MSACDACRTNICNNMIYGRTASVCSRLLLNSLHGMLDGNTEWHYMSSDAALSLFETATSSDTAAASPVHYLQLQKAIIMNVHHDVVWLEITVGCGDVHI